MKNNFKYPCGRRSVPRGAVIENNEKKNAQEDQPLGAGSGGNPPKAPMFTVTSEGHKGGWGIGAAMLTFTANPEADFPTVPPVVSLLAGDYSDSMNGRVEAHATQGVRISSGPPSMPPASNPNIAGVEIQTSDAQLIKITRGFTPATSQSIIMYPDSISIIGGPAAYGVSISSDTMITLSVGPTSSISLTPAGVTIKGLLTKIN